MNNPELGKIERDLSLLAIRCGLIQNACRWEPSPEVLNWLDVGGVPDACCVDHLQLGMDVADKELDRIYASDQLISGWWYYRMRMYQAALELVRGDVVMGIALLASAHEVSPEKGQQEIEQVSAVICDLNQIIADHHLAALRTQEAEANRWLTREVWRIKGFSDFQIVLDWSASQKELM